MDNIACTAQSMLDQHWATLREHAEDLRRIFNDDSPGSMQDCQLVRLSLLVVIGELAIRRMRDEESPA